MANYTENYGLHQWEAKDPVLRTDFNEDFRKIDSALMRKADKADLAAKADKTALKEVQNLAEGRCQVVVGSYIGNGGKTTITVNLGGRPRAVIFPHEAVSTTIISGWDRYGITITSSGFTVGSQSYLDPFQSNQEGVRQYYLALM